MSFLELLSELITLPKGLKGNRSLSGTSIMRRNRMRKESPVRS